MPPHWLAGLNGDALRTRCEASGRHYVGLAAVASAAFTGRPSAVQLLRPEHVLACRFAFVRHIYIWDGTDTIASLSQSFVVSSVAAVGGPPSGECVVHTTHNVDGCGLQKEAAPAVARATSDHCATSDHQPHVVDHGDGHAEGEALAFARATL